MTREIDQLGTYDVEVQCPRILEATSCALHITLGFEALCKEPRCQIDGKIVFYVASKGPSFPIRICVLQPSSGVSCLPASLRVSTRLYALRSTDSSLGAC